MAVLLTEKLGVDLNLNRILIAVSNTKVSNFYRVYFVFLSIFIEVFSTHWYLRQRQVHKSVLSG